MANWLGSLVSRMHHEEGGQGIVEYMLLIVFVALAATAGMSNFAVALNSLFTAVGSLVGTYI